MHLCVTRAHCGYEVHEYKGKLKQHFPQPLTLPTLSRILLSRSKQKSQPWPLVWPTHRLLVVSFQHQAFPKAIAEELCPSGCCAAEGALPC